jgi:CheY-like chemotaxis protein
MESVGRLAGGVAHDFNNLLTVINGHCDLLLARLSAADPLRFSVNEVRSAGERAAALTQQLLAFSRRQILQTRVLDLNAVIRETASLLKRLIGEDVQLAISLDPALGMIKADPGQISQVLLNLAVNARDAMQNGGHLTLETANVEFDESHAAAHEDLQAGRYVQLAVSDDGTGIDEETQRHLFEPFFTTKEQGKGTGLGLATVYGVVRQSGGWISVSSEPGTGSTFRIYLPAVDAPAESPAAVPQAPSPESGSETILIVEDQESVRKFACAVLQRFGYRVLEAASGEHALAVAEAHDGPIDLLLTDVIMPGISGKALVDRLQSNRAAIRVLYMSGYPGKVIGRHGVPDEDAAFLQKPFGPDDLGRKVRELLAR